MHSAPSVSYPVGRSRNAIRGLGVLWAAGSCCAGAALLQFDHWGWRQALLLASVVLSAVAAQRTLGYGVIVDLVFDGQEWSLSGLDARKAAKIVVLLDLQVLMLVRLDEPEQRARWLWLERRARSERWQDLRRAIFARALSSSEPSSTAKVAP